TKMQETKAAAADTMLGIQDSISQSVNALITGQQTAAQALAGVTLDVIDLFLKQALAAAIANAVKFGGPLPIGLALAGVALGAVKALFAKNTGRSGGGGGGGGSAGGVGARPQSREQFRTERAGMQIVLGGEFKIRNDDLVLALDKGNVKRQRLG